MSSFQSQSSFRAWITRVAINEVSQSYRRRQSRSVCQTFDDIAALDSPVESQLQALARAEMTRDVRNTIIELPAKYKKVLTLRSFEELSLLEIAQSVRLSVPAVKTRLFRARMICFSRKTRTMLSRAASNAARRGREG
jgi:RNA polymerase sigma-70 factor (ECF subfamily)